MTFDLVIGNPPYQNGKNDDKAGNIWSDFLYKSLEISDLVAMITPSSWLTASADMKKNIRIVDKYKDHYKVINIAECARHFEGVGSTFTYFIIDKNNKYKKTKIILPKGEIDIDFTKDNVLPYDKDGSPKTLSDFISFRRKFTTNNSDEQFKWLGQGYGCDNEIKPMPNGEYLYYHTPSTRKNTNPPPYEVKNNIGTWHEYDRPHKHQKKPKVMVSLSGKYKPVLDAKGEYGYTNMILPILCENEKEAIDVFTKLNKNNIIDYIEKSKTSGFVNIQSLISLKNI